MTELRGTDPYRPPDARIASDGVERQKVPNKRVFGFLVDVYILGCVIAAFDWVLPLLGTGLAALLLLLRDTGGRSPGKWLAGLRVEEPSAARCSFGRSVIRNAVVLVMMFVPIALIVEYIALRVTKEEQRIGDMLAKTLVVDLRPEVGDGRYLVYSLLLIVGVAAFLVFMAHGAGVYALPD